MKDLFPRLISSIFYVSAILGSLYFGLVSFIILLSIFCIIIIVEYGRVLRNNTSKKLKSLFEFEFYPLIFFICFFVIGLQTEINPIMSISTVKAGIYTVVFFNFVLLIENTFKRKSLFNNKKLKKTWPLYGVIGSFLLIIFSCLTYNFSDYKFYFLYYLILIWVIDTFGYLIGIAFGKNKLFESLSPKKTIEGAVGSLIFSIIYGLIISFFVEIKIVIILILCIITCFFAVTGDLIQSKIKRELEIKDFGKLLPGHGGLFDRLDSLLFSFPIIYLIIEIYLYVS